MEDNSAEGEKTVALAAEMKGRRPLKVNIPPVKVGPARSMDTYPLKYSQALEHNQKLNLCCRHMENLSGQMYKTYTAIDGPDLFIATCTCGRKHYRMAVGQQG